MIKKVIKIVFGALLITILLTYFELFISNLNKELPEIDFLNVGQGDASLIKLPNNKKLLIDGGPDNLVVRRLGETLPFFQRKIDLVILSHPHDDHILGLIEVIKRYKIGALIYMRQNDAPELLVHLLEVARQKNVNIIELEDSVTMNLGSNCKLKVINPENLDIKEDPNNSLVAKIYCPSLSALFTGDNNSSVEEELLKMNEDWRAQILKAAHHGSKTANSAEFISAVKPSIFIISVGLLNRFGHPNTEVLELVSRLGIKIKRTDKDGTIKIKAPQ
ncbi:MAG: MBL fold metallo-hydrolase [Candidatus Falkowbacteria bacterium]